MAKPKAYHSDRDETNLQSRTSSRYDDKLLLVTVHVPGSDAFESSDEASITFTSRKDRVCVSRGKGVIRPVSAPAEPHTRSLA